MTPKFVRVHCDVDCEWHDATPRYRIFVNGELFTERTWIWTDASLEEMLQIEAPPGMYNIDFALVEDGAFGKLTTKNLRVEYGDGRIVNNNVLEIVDYEIPRNT